MKFLKIILPLFYLAICLSANAQDSDSIDEKETKDFEFRAVAELGFLSVLGHKVQFGENGTYFDYKEDGGQNVLFPVGRVSLELDIKERNTFILLYQPLTIQTQVLLNEDIVVDDLVFPANTSVDLLYNFPFYRISYLRELLPNKPRFALGVGGSIQLRNATITFESTDGERFRTNRDVGVVPALKVRSRYDLSDLVYLELEADGIYAPISYLNGSDNEVKGAILDASIRSGLKVTKDVNAFLNLRYLGGGAVGTSENEPGPGDGYVKNWLHFMTVTAGLTYTFN
ncbi:hypothetical protein PBT90_12000 [Algoriphagus halophytocola]|uniref:Outer membrane protein beta-barrel domain-containing protein n=1 Tax=Algoriphagus halophytocola TaxID=2991499 RepID=A0ABY6MKD5_9BACT|nr:MULTISPECIES: hypothetical protein [unclassified Algoriphagus]UZD24108.1 hypothetical protein OM944_06310 [Algoriphagus sp. TR-M5]WBL41479.1 hypothetical protein PBT90_12000 [Algoriphagus sp. TR-M9]